MKKFPFFLLGLLLSLSGCQVGEKWHTSNLFFFDTVCEIKIYSSKSLFKSAQKDVLEAFTEIEKLFSPQSSDYSSPATLYLYHRAMEIHRRSGGGFDLTVAPLTQAWGFLDSSHRLPPADKIKALLNLIGMEKIKEENGRLILPPGIKLDWGGIAKGYGVDLACQRLIQKGIQRGFINAGGDLYCWGHNPERNSWQVGVKHPRRGGFLGVLSISNLGAATSGDYQRFFIENGTRYHHIFNPQTGYPAQGKQSVTVVGPETLVCDALSTALFVSGVPGEVLTHYPDYAAIIVDAEGKLLILGKKYSFRPLE